MAELESSLICERVTAGMRAAEARGRHLGRPQMARRIVTPLREFPIRATGDTLATNARRTTISDPR